MNTVRGDTSEESAEEAARRDPVRTIEAALDHAHAVQADFNPFAFIDDEGANRAAEALKAKAARGEAPGALAALPISVKDILDVAGLPTRWGSTLFREAPAAKADIAAVARLRAAGAIILGKTTTSEFAHAPLGLSPLTGLTRNPWAVDLTCGGSSAGAGVSVAAGVTAVTLATDAGCSTRLPAACTGTFGLKPTLGLIPHDRVPEAFASFIHLGLLGRRVADIARVLPVVAGAHPSDPQSQAHATGDFLRDTPAVSLEGRKILLWMTAGNGSVAAEVVATTRRAAVVLRDLGAEIVEEDYPLAAPDPVWRTLQQANWAARFANTSEHDRAQLSATLQAGVNEGLSYSGLTLQRALIKRTEIFRGVQQVFGRGIDLILTPCVSAPPVAADFDLTTPLMVDGVAAGDLRSEWTPYLSLFDLSGHPAIAMPAGFAKNGAPLGVQLVAPWHADAALLAAAAAYEKRVPPPVWRPSSRHPPAP